MGAGSKVSIRDRDDFGEEARVINGALLVTGISGGGGGGDVNITAVGGVLIGTTVPVSGTVNVVEPVSVDDNGGSLTVDGTVAVSSLAGNVTVVQPTHDNLNANANIQVGDVDVGNANPVPVSDAGGSLTVDGTLAISSVAGTVTVAGTVAVSAVVPGTGATNLGKAEDSPHTSGDVGVMALAVRNDAGTPLAADQDYIPLTTDSAGALRVNIATPALTNVRLQDGGGADLTTVKQDSAPVGASAAAPLTASMVQAPLLGENGTHAVNDLVFSRADAAGNLFVSGFLMDRDVASTGNIVSVKADGDALSEISYGLIPMFQVGSPEVELTDSTWQHAYITSGGRIAVDAEISGTVVISSITPGTTATSLGKAEDALHASGDVGVMPLAVRQDTLSVLAANGDYIPFLTDSLGRLRVYTESGKRTYRAAVTNTYVQVTAAAMFFVIGGSSTQTIRVQRIVVSGMTLADVAYHTLVVEKWSTAPTGGTSAALTKVPLDANFAAATATLVQTYSVTPTEGTLVGTIASRRMLIQDDTPAAAGIPPEAEFDFRSLGESGPVTLRGTAQCLSLAFGVAPATGMTLSLEIEWTEED